MKKVMILGAEISDISPSEAVKTVHGFLADSDQHYIVTPNPEIVLAASRSAKLRFIFDNADLSLPDGFGLKIGAWILGQKLHNRIAGVDFMLEISSLAQVEGRGVFLLGGATGVAQKAAAKLQEKYPGIKITGAVSGGKVRKINNEWVASEAGLIEKINQSQAEILFVAFGCPKQEKWMFHNLSKLESVKLAMTVGGSFDFLAGTAQRAPLMMR
ncbi:MAG: WecB/TagA/CpsF family glycosyltransferase [Candidatus Komeilibacteria bacterium]|nr:WecB/TagA/CpsF family glycosyltransferase [Candidatus Komeilibacteria bacterium]